MSRRQFSDRSRDHDDVGRRLDRWATTLESLSDTLNKVRDEIKDAQKGGGWDARESGGDGGGGSA